MAVYTIVFSPTGGTKKAADLFAEAFCKDYVTIDLTERGRDFSKDSFCAGRYLYRGSSVVWWQGS